MPEKELEYMRVKLCSKCNRLKMLDPCVWCYLGAEPHGKSKEKEKQK